MTKKLITLLAIVIANQQPSVAQPIPSGEYVSNFGSEDYWVRVVDGRITSAEGSTRHSPPVSQFQILDFNSLIPAIKVKTHQNHIKINKFASDSSPRSAEPGSRGDAESDSGDQ